MQDKVLAIYCGNASKEEIKNIQTHFFDEGNQWYSSKFNGERKYKENISNYIILEADNMFECDENTLKSITDAELLIFESPLGFLRNYKIKKIKSNI